MYKIHNNLVPDYIKQIFPSTRGSLSRYNTRNRSDYSIPKCRLQVVPDVINPWNLLQIDATSLNISKNILKTFPNQRLIFELETVKLISYILNYDTTVYYITIYFKDIGSPICSCGQVEISYHFFFSCPSYNQARNRFFNELLKIDQIHTIIDTHFLHWGHEALPESLN